MRWLSGVRSFHVNGRAETPVDVSIRLVLAALLLRVSGSTDGNSSVLLDELISIANRPGSGGHTGIAPLTWLQGSPGNQKYAQAAADAILDRARSDSKFSA